LGLWIAQREGAKFWLHVVTELKNRGVSDIFIACVDGLKGFPEAIESVFPRAGGQLCIVHLVRHSLKFVGWKQRKEVAAALKKIYASATEAETRLAEFAEKWDERFPMISRSWRANWPRMIPFFAHPPDSTGDLHDQRHRVAQHVFAKSNQNTQLISKRCGGAEITLPGTQKYRQALDHADARLEGCPQPLRHHLRRPDAERLNETGLWKP
jgi:transposase-like protein